MSLDVAIVYNSEIRDNGTPYYFRKALAAVLGRKPDWYLPYGDLPKHDFYIYIDDGRDDLKWLPPGPWGYYATDTHLGWEYRRWKAGQADLVWCAQKPAAEKMAAEGMRAKWVPLACSPDDHPNKPERTAKYDVGFVGHLQAPEVSNRLDFLGALFRAIPNFRFEYGRFHADMAAVYHDCRIGLNHAVRDDLNMRFFELASAGVPQLCDRRMVGLADLGFFENEHYYGYSSTEEAVERAKSLLTAKPEELDEVAWRAFYQVRKGHTYEDRMRSMIFDIREFLK